MTTREAWWMLGNLCLLSKPHPDFSLHGCETPQYVSLRHSDLYGSGLCALLSWMFDKSYITYRQHRLMRSRINKLPPYKNRITAFKFAAGMDGWRNRYRFCMEMAEKKNKEESWQETMRKSSNG